MWGWMLSGLKVLHHAIKQGKPENFFMANSYTESRCFLTGFGKKWILVCITCFEGSGMLFSVENEGRETGG
jgi:hypothetical protein